MLVVQVCGTCTAIAEHTPSGSRTSVINSNSTQATQQSVELSERTFPVTRKEVRVLLLSTFQQLTLKCLDTVHVSGIAENPPHPVSCLGTFQIGIQLGKNSDRVKVGIIPSGGKQHSVVLPCTLSNQLEDNIIEVQGKGYRGALILTGNKKTGLSLINYCSIEDYLKGVVPLEIGVLTHKEIEALKAQAVAARTYTYTKINTSSIEQSYDLVSTIADQVYGGVCSEYSLCNAAILATRDQVLRYNNSLICAYYHSTCGGTTANVSEVWDKPQTPYLQSVRDVDANGRPYCSQSSGFTWREQWDPFTLAGIITQFSVNARASSNGFKEPVQALMVEKRFACGRVSMCKIVSAYQQIELGGDKLRFVLRQAKKDFPILKSACFSVLKKEPRLIEIEGHGFGHGVGMCQMGAISRSRDGQTYERILSSYYTGCTISRVKRRTPDVLAH